MEFRAVFFQCHDTLCADCKEVIRKCVQHFQDTMGRDDKRQDVFLKRKMCMYKASHFLHMWHKIYKPQVMISLCIVSASPSLGHPCFVTQKLKGYRSTHIMKQSRQHGTTCRMATMHTGLVSHITLSPWLVKVTILPF